MGLRAATVVDVRDACLISGSHKGTRVRSQLTQIGYSGSE
jgi:hypothetical protein